MSWRCFTARSGGPRSGWRIPMGGGSGRCVYRVSWLKEAGYDRIPDDLAGFLDLCQKLKKIGHPCGFALGHAVGDANGFCQLAAVVARRAS